MPFILRWCFREVNEGNYYFKGWRYGRVCENRSGTVDLRYHQQGLFGALLRCAMVRLRLLMWQLQILTCGVSEAGHSLWKPVYYWLPPENCWTTGFRAVEPLEGRGCDGRTTLHVLHLFLHLLRRITTIVRGREPFFGAVIGLRPREANKTPWLRGQRP